MASVSKTLSPTSAETGLRPFNVRRDLGPVADLVELCFDASLDADGRLYLQRMRVASQQPALLQMSPLLWGSMLWGNIPLTGYVWQQDGRVVGNASLIQYGLLRPRLFLIANVAVHPDYRRQGIARKLTIQAIEHARQRHVPAIWLHVRDDNPAAVSLYQSMGFIERTRRTTWFSRPLKDSSADLDGLRVISPRRKHWSAVRAWLLRSYPPDFSWHIPLKIDLLRPGFRGTFLRFLYGCYVGQWAGLLDGRLAGTVSWQFNPPRANYVWLAAPADADEKVLSKLLLHVRHELEPDRGLVLDYPARQSAQALLEAGFTPHQTLIWMQMSLA